MSCISTADIDCMKYSSKHSLNNGWNTMQILKYMMKDWLTEKNFKAHKL